MFFYFHSNLSTHHSYCDAFKSTIANSVDVVSSDTFLMALFLHIWEHQT